MAVPVLGMMGTGNYGADDRPKNWRQMILRLQPNGDMPLMGILSMTGKEGTSDPEFSWFEKDLAVIVLYINNGAGYASGITTFTVDDGAGVGIASAVKEGTLLVCQRTGEVMRVTSDPIGATSINVARSIGATAAAALVDNDALYVIGSAYEEGASVSKAISWLPTKVYNYCQIFRTTLDATRTNLKTTKRWGTGTTYDELMLDAWEVHMKGLEMAILWGERSEAYGSTNHPMRTTDGLLARITTNVTDFSGVVIESAFDSFLEGVFRYGNYEKLAVCGSQALSTVNDIAKSKGWVEPVPANSSYGMHLLRYITPHGTLLLKSHPLMNQLPDMRDLMIVVDMPAIKYRYVDDTQLLLDRQETGADRLTDEFLTEAGFEIQEEKRHAVGQNMTAYAP